MTIRRIVTGKSATGKSIVVQDGTSPREVALQHTPGFMVSPIWVTAKVPSLPTDGTDPMAEGGTLLPPPGGSTFIVITVPPDQVMVSPDFRPDLAGPEHVSATPGIAETFEMDAPGMHTTPTVDYGCVVDGEIWMELDDGVVVHLTQGDVIVQNGTRHGWRNRSDKPATLAFVLLGAKT